MRSALIREIARISALISETVMSSALVFGRACLDARFQGPAARVATTSTLAVVLAVSLANALHLPEPWWAAISGLMATQRSGADSVRRAILRILGTIVGAGLGVMAISWIAYDMIACTLVLFAVALVGLIGANVSRYAYAWLLIVVTFGLVVLPSLDAPPLASVTAVYRVLEVTVGTVCAVGMALVLEPTPALPPAVERGWSGLLGPQLDVTLYAIRWAVAVAMLPWLWRLFGVTGMTQMAVTLVAVLATPVASDPRDTNRQILTKGLQRLVGCAAGGVAGLALLGLGIDSTVPWLLSLAVPVWLFAYVANGSHTATYVGTQAGVVLVMTLIQGHGPPTSLEPALDRLAGIFLGLLIVMAVVLLTTPPRRPATAPSA